MEDIRAQLKGLRLSDGSSPLDLRISSAPSRAAPADRSVPGKSNGGLRSSDPLEMFSALNKGISFQSSATPTPSSMSVDRANNGSPMPRSTNGGVTDKPVPVPQPRSMDGSPKQQLSNASPLHQPHLTTSDLKAIESNDFVQDLLRHPFVDNQLAISPVVRTLSHLKNPDGRYIIVGDIHGCVEELRNLVKKLQYRRGVDVLIMVGDYVVKGPQSVAVLQECRALGAIGVLGNHDFTLLNCCSKCRSAPFTEAELKDPVKRLAQQMPLECELYLRSLPHMLRLPQFNVLVVHAGINVGLDLNHQSIVEVMHLRRLEEVEEPKKKANSSTAVKSKYKAIIKGNNGTEWAELWNGPELVVFGHDALRGFQKHEYAYGIDTGCVYGGPLTCVVFSRSTPQGEFVSVPGLPKNTNETLGLPPPDSSVYEQMEIDLERLLLRSTRNTPGTVTPCSFHFASSPAGAQSSASTHPGSARPLTAVNTSNNQRTTPASMFPSKAVTPPTSHMSSPTWSTGGGVTAGSASGELASQKATVLTLAKEGELRALNLVIQLSAYENVLCSAISSEMNNIKSQEDFWCPFAMFTLDGAIKRLNNRREPPQELDDAIQLVMEICDDMPLVRSKCSPFFAELVEPLVSKSIHKHAALLSRINDSSSPSSKQ